MRYWWHRAWFNSDQRKEDTVITLWKTHEGFVWMPDRRCSMCGQENPEQLRKCIDEKDKELEEFLKKGGVLRSA